MRAADSSGAAMDRQQQQGQQRGAVMAGPADNSGTAPFKLMDRGNVQPGVRPRQHVRVEVAMFNPETNKLAWSWGILVWW